MNSISVLQRPLFLVVLVVVLTTVGLAQSDPPQPGDPLAWQWVNMLAPVITLVAAWFVSFIKPKVGAAAFVTFIVPAAGMVVALLMQFLVDAAFWPSVILAFSATWIHQVIIKWKDPESRKPTI